MGSSTGLRVSLLKQYGFVSMCVNMTLFFMAIFTRAPLKGLLWMSGNPSQKSDTHFLASAWMWTPAHIRIHIHTHLHSCARTMNRMPCFFSVAYRAQCECQPVALLLHSCPSASSQGPPVVPQGRGACASQVPLHSLRMPESGLEKAVIFCVQWTAGTFQITAEFKVSTKAANMDCLFVYPCLLMSLSIRPNWFVSTSIHTISQHH